MLLQEKVLEAGADRSLAGGSSPSGAPARGGPDPQGRRLLDDGLGLAGFDPLASAVFSGAPIPISRRLGDPRRSRSGSACARPRGLRRAAPRRRAPHPRQGANAHGRHGRSPRPDGRRLRDARSGVVAFLQGDSSRRSTLGERSITAFRRSPPRHRVRAGERRALRARRPLAHGPHPEVPGADLDRLARGGPSRRSQHGGCESRTRCCQSCTSPTTTSSAPRPSSINRSSTGHGRHLAAPLGPSQTPHADGALRGAP